MAQLRYDIYEGVINTKSKLQKFILGAAALSFAAALVISAGAAQADSMSINFESPYTTGSINGQQGWSGSGQPISPAIDQSVVSNTYGYVSFGTQSFRMSNAYTDGGFGNWPFSPSLANEAGETDAQNNGFSGGSRQPHFEVSWDFASADPLNEQVGLQLSTAPDRGDGARMSFIKMRDTSTGLAVDFADYQDIAPLGSLSSPTDGCDAGDDFITTTVATNLSRAVPHTIKLTMDFNSGPHNDVVKVYVDGVLKHTGTSWEDYFRWCTESGGGTGNPSLDVSRTVDSMIFQARSGGGTAPDTIGKGFLIDNFSYVSGPIPPVLISPTDKDQCKKNGWQTLTDDQNRPFKNQGDCVSWVNHNVLGHGTSAASR